MIDSIISCLNAKGVVRFVNTTTQIKEKISYPSNIEWYYIEDVRSAVFNAYGMSKISHSPVAIIVEEAYLPNTYTALTEAWLQRVQVIVLALNSMNLDSSFYLNRCVDASILIDNVETIEGVVCNAIQHHGPTLIKIKEEVNEEKKIDYTNLFSIIDLCAKDEKILCYNPQYGNKDYEFIPPEYKYGVISKYVGQLIGGKQSVLCIPEYLLALDTNIFNFRDFPDGFKLIVKYSNGVCWGRLNTWMQRNNINTYVVDGRSFEYTTMNFKPNYAILVK